MGFLGFQRNREETPMGAISLERRQSAKVKSPLEEIVLLVASATIARADDLIEVAECKSRRSRAAVQKSSIRIGTRVPTGRAGASMGRTMRQSASARGRISEESWLATGVTSSVPSAPRWAVARM